MILLIGANGNMGRRYQAILRYLGREFIGVDTEHPKAAIHSAAAASDGVLVATPTETHASILMDLCALKVPILCEKPISRDIVALERVLGQYRAVGTPLRMVMQYQMLADATASGPTFYDYYRHGSDGLAWDCISIIALANSGFTLKDTSPIWRCTINGREIHYGDMDAAYVGYVQKWLAHPAQSIAYLRAVHHKTAQLEGCGADRPLVGGPI